MRRLIYIVCLLGLSLTVCAAAPSTEGTDFWLTFMRNIRPVELSLFASARTNTTVTVENPNTHWTTSFEVAAGSVATCTLPTNQCYMTLAGQAAYKGLRVTTTAPISLYASNFAEYTYDATLVLPVTALGKSYIIQTYEDKSETAELAVVATTDNTTLTITPHARTTDGHVKNVAYTVLLQAGEAYQLFSKDDNGDFSGTYVRADQPVAVFAGHACANVPESNLWCDHLVEQQRPVSQWGRQFAITRTAGQDGNRVMLTAKNNHTLVELNGTQVAELQALESYTFRLTQSSAYVQCTEPVACFLYPEGARDNGLYGDPSSVSILPLEQRARDITFATFRSGETTSHYANVVTTADGAAAMRLDGQSVASAFAPVADNSSLRFAQLPVSAGTHVLRTTEDGFVGYVYGMGFCESYAYALGSAIYALETDPHDGFLGVPYIEIDCPEIQCYQDAVAFRLLTNLDYDAVLWDFGDGATDNRPTASHTYASPGAYTVTLTLTQGDYSSSVQRTVVLSDLFRDTLHVDRCEGEGYTIEGKRYTETGQYIVRQTSGAGCDSILVLDLQVHPTYHTVEEATFPKGGSYRWHNQRYRIAGTYIDRLQSVYGCDSVTELHLTETDATEEMYDTICWQPIYRFRNHDYPLPSVEGYEDRPFVHYTLCYNSKYQCQSYRMHLAIVPRIAGVYTVYDTIRSGQTYTWFDQTYSREGTYSKTLGDNACMQEYTLHLTVLPFPVETTDTAFCHEDTIRWRGKAYTAPGLYADTVYTAVGIEGVYRLRLTDNRSFTQLQIHDVVSFDFNGHLLTESGTYRDTLTNAAGCDSVVTLHLGILEPCTILVEEHLSLCEGEQTEWNNQTCEAGHDYTASFVTSDGCDSVVTLHLTALPVKHETQHIGICEGDYLRIGSRTFADEGDYTVRLTAANGCDSVIDLHLTYKPSWADTVDAVIVLDEQYLWQGGSYTQSGLYTQGFIASNGCDSIETLRLTVLPCRPSSEEVYDTILAGMVYPFEGMGYDETGVYTRTLKSALGCDSVRTLYLEVNHLAFTALHTDDHCADEDLLTWEIAHTGIARQVRLLFDEKAHAAGLNDTVLPMPADGRVVLPCRLRAGRYTGSMELLFRTSATIPQAFAFTLFYPSSVLEQAWDDVIAVLTYDYNGGYHFTAYQWYKDGVALIGENHSYLYQPLVMGAEYSALLTEPDGTQLMTCPLIARPQQEMSLYPTIAAPRHPIRCYVPDDGSLTIYDAYGHRAGERTLRKGENSFEAPDAVGIYILRISLNGADRPEPYKLIVQ